MSARFEELDWRETPMGAISLRRRREPATGTDVFEAKLDDDFLMSSLFTVAEEAMARLGLEAVPGVDLDVLVGGLGLGYTAAAALADPRVGSLLVLEALPEVVGWHERGLLPVSATLTGDPRCRLMTGDFFATVGAGRALGDEDGFDLLLVDIDHTPRHVLHPSHEPFYSVAGLTAVRSRLRSAGAFVLWSDDPPDEPLMSDLRAVFTSPQAHVVEFANPLTGGMSANPLTGGMSANTVYVATA